LLIGVKVNTMRSVESRPQTAVRRKPAGERFAEITDTAAALAVSEGLDKVTAKSVAGVLGVFPGLVTHYFATADELVAAAFAQAVTAERDEVFGHAALAERPLGQLRRLLEGWLHQDRDPVSLLWLDAWQASRRRPALRTEVGRQMNADLDRLSALIGAGIAAGDFSVDNPREPALQILSLIDGLSVQAATRATLDYTPVRTMVITTAETLLGLKPGALAPSRRASGPEQPGTGSTGTTEATDSTGTAETTGTAGTRGR
jgi:AcrR family transcriptional regulator